jgi:hypothetical protein
MKDFVRSAFGRQRRRLPHHATSSRRSKAGFGLVALTVFVSSLFLLVPTVFQTGVSAQKGGIGGGAQEVKGKETNPKLVPHSSQAVGFAVTPASRDIKPEPLTPEEMEKFNNHRSEREKNPSNVKSVKPPIDPKKTGPFTDPVINNFKKSGGDVNAVTPPIQNFDGLDADLLPGLFGGRFAPPDTNAAVGPNHVVITTNSMVQVFSKTGTPLTVPARISTLLVGIANAADDDGDPIVLYDPLADRWIISQFNLRFTNNQMHMHFAVSQTGDPTGAYFAYDFLTNPGRFVDYPHVGVWPDGYYFSSNDFTPPGVAPFLGAGCYTLERAKMLVGDPTAKIIGFNLPNTEGGMLPTNLQGFTPPPAGTPNLFIEFDADEFGAATDLIRVFEFRPDFNNPPSSTLTQLPDIPVAAFDARQPASRADIAQPAPGEGLDGISDRLMHALNFRVLPGGVQSFVFNWTVNVSGVAPTSSATFQAGVRWMEVRRDAMSGALTINQQATYAPGAGDPTGRDLWMAAVAQDGEGNIGLAANAANTTATPTILNPTAIYTGRLAGDPANTLPQGEVDALSAVTKGVQTATVNRWGDYSSLFIDPADECTFWAAFEYVDAPTATFDWNTRIFSFKVNPTCATAARGTFNGTITNCITGQPIEGAIITTTDGFFRQTDASGIYSIQAAPGTYNVSVTAPGGFNTVTGMVTVTDGGTTTFNACLAPSAIIQAAGATIVSESCTPSNGVIDPGETVTVALCVQNVGAADTVNLVGTLQNTGGVTSASGPQNYGVVVAGGPAVCRNFTFTAAGMCGGMITATLDLQDSGGTGASLGSVTYNFTLGTLNTVLNENWDGVVAPALPAGWVATTLQDVANNSNPWATDTTTPDTAPNSVFTNDPNNISDEVLESPTINIMTNQARLTFRHNFVLENTFDGGVVEVSSPNINGGAYTDITNAAVGGSFTQGGYTATISANFGSPIGGRMAFTGSSGGYITTIANLGPNVAGQMIKLRFRRATDNSVASTGWRVDGVTVTDGFVCCTTNIVPCMENFDSVTPPALPMGWAAVTALDCINSNPWATTTNNPDTAPNTTFVNDPNCISDERLVSPPTPIVSATAVLTFRHNFDMETGFDGGVIEVSTDGGATFQDIIAAGGTFVGGTQGYNGTISVNFGSPIGGRMAFTGNSGGYVTTSINLPAGFNGQSMIVSWRRGTDSSVSDVGWFVDTISVAGSNCAAQPCTITCPADITVSNDPDQCGAVVNYPAPMTTGSCGTVTCTPPSGSFFPVGTTLVTCTTSAGPSCSFNVTVNDTQPPTITCPADITVSNDPDQCGAIVNYPPPTVSDNCPGVTAPVCAPPSGSFFPVGTTLVTCMTSDAAGNTASCSFNVTVNDTQPPTITCPANVVTTTVNPGDTSVQVCYPPPTATDNCPGVTTVCTPPSGSTFPVGVTTVTCTATDASGNTASCSFTVSVFNARLQDNTNPATVLLWNTVTGQYIFCCNGTTFTGTGKTNNSGNNFVLDHNAQDRRVRGSLSAGSTPPRGNASLQFNAGSIFCTIVDSDIRNNTSICGGVASSTCNGKTGKTGKNK